MRKCAVALALALTTLGIGAAAAVPNAVQAAPASGLGAGGEFHALTPFRAYDSRPESPINEAAPGRKAISPSSEFTVKLAGTGTLPAATADVLAVVVSVTVVDPNGSGWLAVRPTGTTGGSSLVNFAPGRNVPNLAVVGVGPDGSITVTLGPAQNASTNVLIDVSGWISTSSSTQRGARLVPVGPARLLDTREGSGPFGPGEVRALPIRGAASYMPTINPAVPNDPNVSAVLVNIAAVNDLPGSTSTFITAAPAPPTPPVPTSNVNVVRGQIKTSLAIVPVVDGNIYLYNHAGQSNVIVDVFGYFAGRADDSSTGRIVPLQAPFRAFDTREGAFGSVPLGTGSLEDWSFKAFAQSVTLPNGGTIDLSQESALLGNLTGTDLGRIYPTAPVTTYLTAFPGGAGRPLVANLNVAESEVVPNMSLIPYGSSNGDDYVVQMYNHAGSMHYLLDVYAIVLK